jgi:O-antigen ligase
MFLFVLALSVSYWYCLPVITQSVVGYSEFRAYDFGLAALILVLNYRYRPQLKAFFRTDPQGRWLHRFCLWCTITFPMTIVHSLWSGDTSWILVSIMYLFHLWGFVFGYAAVRLFVRNVGQGLRLMDVFLVAGIAEAVLICLQSMGYVGRLWSDLYAGYGDRAFSGTLGLNRVLPGMTMLLVIVVAIAYVRQGRRIGVVRLLMAFSAFLSAALALAVTGSRTAWLGAAAYLVATLLFRFNLRLAAFGAIAAAGIIWAAPARLVDQIEETYRWRLESHLSKVQGEGLRDQLTAVDAGRLHKWEETLDAIIEHPLVVPLGMGFNNRVFTEYNTPHNMYLALVIETGIAGLALYVAWMLAGWRESSIRLRMARTRGGLPFAAEMKPLIIAMLLTLGGGEHLYVYRPVFALFGMYLMVIAILGHPCWVPPPCVREEARTLVRWAPIPAPATSA